LWEASGQPDAELKFKFPVETVLNIMKQVTRAFPINQTNVLRIQGRLDWLVGERSRAQQVLTASLREAEKLAMPYEQGMAHFQIARRLDADDPARKQHKDQAVEIFKRVGAIYQLARTQML
jgi:hypothetical protein